MPAYSGVKRHLGKRRHAEAQREQLAVRSCLRVKQGHSTATRAVRLHPWVKRQSGDTAHTARRTTISVRVTLAVGLMKVARFAGAGERRLTSAQTHIKHTHTPAHPAHTLGPQAGCHRRASWHSHHAQHSYNPAKSPLHQYEAGNPSSLQSDTHVDTFGGH